MKTKHVRPVLVESKDIHSQLEIDDIFIGKLSYKVKQYHCKHPQELILISLEDKKIDENKDRYFESSNGSIKTIVKAGLKIKTIGIYYNIEARQSQIPPKYISKFIEQYNNDDYVEDLEIEMEYYWINSDGIKGEFFTEVAKFEPSINQYDAVLINQPKLTNGFVTIIEKNTITYTEEEVKQLLSKFGNHIMIHPNLDFGEEYEEAINWFENNKKKSIFKTKYHV